MVVEKDHLIFTIIMKGQIMKNVKQEQTVNLIDFDQLVEQAQTEQAVIKASSTMTREECLTKYGSKSNAIRHLTHIGWKRGQIATFLNIKYQFVRNVQVTPVGKRPDLL